MAEKPEKGSLALHQALPDYLTVKEVAERLGVSQTSVRNYIHSDRLPASALGSLFLVHVDDLRHFERTIPISKQAASLHSRREIKAASPI